MHTFSSSVGCSCWLRRRPCLAAIASSSAPPVQNKDHTHSRQQTADSRQQTSKTRDKGHKTSKTRDKGHTHTEQATNKQDTRVNRQWTIDKQDPKGQQARAKGHDNAAKPTT
jgi:hypothetical protein